MMKQDEKIPSPLVSVIMPVHNTSRFLRQAIESVLLQSYENLELIAVDDCSTDDSVQILREYAEKDSRVHVLPGKTNCGTAHTRNRGIAAAKGAYIALLDSDDVWKPFKLEKQVRLLTDTSADLTYCSIEFIDQDDRPLNRSFIVPPQTSYQKMLTQSVITCSTIVASAELMKKHPFRSTYFHEDYVLWMELLALPIKVLGTPEMLAYYRQVAGSKSNNKLYSAMQRWRIYRKALGMNFWASSAAFAGYAFYGIMKYYKPTFKKS